MPDTITLHPVVASASPDQLPDFDPPVNAAFIFLAAHRAGQRVGFIRRGESGYYCRLHPSSEQLGVKPTKRLIAKLNRGLSVTHDQALALKRDWTLAFQVETRPCDVPAMVRLRRTQRHHCEPIDDVLRDKRHLAKPEPKEWRPASAAWIAHKVRSHYLDFYPNRGSYKWMKLTCWYEIEWRMERVDDVESDSEFPTERAARHVTDVSYELTELSAPYRDLTTAALRLACRRRDHHAVARIEAIPRAERAAMFREWRKLRAPLWQEFLDDFRHYRRIRAICSPEAP